MKVSVKFSDQPSIEESLRVEKRIGEGKFSVFHVYSASHKTSYALKVFPKNTFGTQQYQKEQIFTSLSHTNVIKNIPITCNSNNFHGLLTEYAKYGDMFGLVAGGALQSEVVIRTYFHQLIEGLEYIHSQGIAHLDLKLENLVLGSGFILKIIDFDQSQSTTDKQLTSSGTQGYRAPEVIENACKDLAAVDIYSAGITLFTMMMNQFPFAEINDQKGTSLHHYATFMKDNSKFWNMKISSSRDSKISVNEDFIELINGLLEYDPKKRLSINEIKASKWYNGSTLSKESLNTEMRKHWNNMMSQKDKAEQVDF